MLREMLKTMPMQAYPSQFNLGTGYLDILGAPYGGYLDGKDIHGTFFSPNTDFLEDMIPMPGLFYWHGTMTKSDLDRYGEIVHRWKDEEGVWFRVKLDLGTDIGKRLWDAAKAGKCFASTGVVPASYSKDAETGEIKSWLIGDLTLIDENPEQGRVPANYYAIAKPLAKHLLMTVVPEDKRELFENVFLTDTEESERREELIEDNDVTDEVINGENSIMKKDLMKLRAYLNAALGYISTLADGMEGDDESPDVSDVLGKCAECQGKDIDEQAKTALLEMNKTVLRLEAEIAGKDHASWVNQQIEAGKVQPSEKEQLLKTLSDAHLSGVGELVKSVMSMVEARNPMNAPTTTQENLRVAGFSSGKKDESLDEAYLARLHGYAGIGGTK